MSTKLRLVLTILALFPIFSSYGQQSQGIWREDHAPDPRHTGAGEALRVEGSRAFLLEEEALRWALATLQGGENETQIWLPDARGTLVGYRVREQSVMAPELQARYPDIRSYLGVGVSDPGLRIRFSMAPSGFQATLHNPEEPGAHFIEKVPGSANRYVLFSGADKQGLPTAWKCATEAVFQKQASAGAGASKMADDQLLRTYRLAVAASGEYTEYHGGTVADALAAINATLTRINEVFSRDLAIQLELVANTDQVIYTDAATDPFGGNLSAEVQTTLDGQIGAANYDIGHLFHQGGEAGNAGFIGAVCQDGRKGSAYAATPIPEGDRFDLDFVAHEMGHQFGANHTWSFDTEGTGVQAEPASGTTIMGYAGIVQGNNVANTGDDYFHYFSVMQIGDYVAGISCGNQTPMSNTPPVLGVLPDYHIPPGTAFVLEGTATDPDPSDVLTYTWEQVDDGVVTTEIFGPENPVGANFRSLPPTAAPIRYFPALDRVVSGNLTQTSPATGDAWETVSNIARDLNFAVTVRDNAIGGGQTAAAVVRVRVEPGGPFQVLSQAGGESYPAGSVQTLTWDVAGTQGSPVNCAQVDVYFSADGGQTFPLLLASGIPNSGTAQVQLPGTATSAARLMVKASDNIFFAVNAGNFSVVEVPFILEAAALQAEACPPADAVFDLVYRSFTGFGDPVDLTAINLPAGLTAVFAPAQVQTSDSPVTLTLSGTGNLAPGTYGITVRATSGPTTFDLPVTLEVGDASLAAPVLQSPSDGASQAPLKPLLQWAATPGSTGYRVQLATDAGFTSILADQMVTTAQYATPVLNPGTPYFWRVKSLNACGEGAYGGPFSFQTITTDCRTLSAQGMPVTISTVGTPTVTSAITFPENLPVASARVSLDLDHSYLSDLVVTLRSPAGTEVTLFAYSCAEANDVNATFDNAGAPFICSNNPAISGTVKPLGNLASFAGEPSQGEWILTIRDTAPADGGRLNAFGLELCVEGALRPDADGDGVFDDGDDLCLGTPPGTTVDASGCPVYRFPQDQFRIALNSESCIGQGDGQMVITAATEMDYTYTLTGSGVNQSGSFTSATTLTGLAAGTYLLCLEGTDGTIVYEAQCFDLQIDSPDPLSVTAAPSADGASLQLDLQGADRYVVTLNGQVQEVVSGALELVLGQGSNALKVEAVPACKGVFEASYFYSERPVASPNPFSTYLDIYAPRPDQAVYLELFNASGALVFTKAYGPGSQLQRVSLPPLPTGIYFLRLTQAGRVQTLKMFRK